MHSPFSPSLVPCIARAQVHVECLSDKDEPMSAFRAVSGTKKAMENNQITPAHL